MILDRLTSPMAAAGGAIALAGLIWTARLWLFRRKAARAQGKIIKVEANRRAAATVYFDDIQGVRRIFTPKEKPSVPYKAGDAVTVLYDPANPGQATLDRPGSWGAPVLVTVLGVGMVLYAAATS
jgi:hypothetical protein